MPILSFANSEDGTPENNIFKVIKRSLWYIAAPDLANRVIAFILTNVTLTTTQKMAIKFVGSAANLKNDDDSVNNLLMYILYGGFQDIGFDEAVEDPLTEEQREACLQQVFLAAKSVIVEHINEVQAFADIQFEMPDWKMSQIPVDPEPVE